MKYRIKYFDERDNYSQWIDTNKSEDDIKNMITLPNVVSIQWKNDGSSVIHTKKHRVFDKTKKYDVILGSRF